MNTKERVRNDILVGMKMYLDSCTMAILDAVIVKAVQNVEMTETTTLPATLDDTNQYIMNLFNTKKAPKLSPKTVAFYRSTLNEFMTLINKPLSKISQSDIEYYLLAKSLVIQMLLLIILDATFLHSLPGCGKKKLLVKIPVMG